MANTIIQVLTSNTFDQWRIVTNTLVNAANELRNNTYVKDSGGLSLTSGSITLSNGNMQVTDGVLQVSKSSGESFYVAADGRIVGTLTTGNVSATGNITAVGTINAGSRLFVAGLNVQSAISSKVSKSGDTITGSLNVSASGLEDALRITQTGTGNVIVFEDETNPDSTPFIIDRTGKVITGHSNSIGSTISILGSYVGSGVQINDFLALQQAYWANSIFGPYQQFLKANSNATGTHGLVKNNDQLGTLLFGGSNGTAFLSGASIGVTVDGTASATSMPTSMRFTTRDVGDSTTQVRLYIANTGNVAVGTAIGATLNPTSKLHVFGDANVTGSLFATDSTLKTLTVSTLTVGTLVANSVDAPAVSDSSSYRLRANQVTRGDGSFAVNQGGANGNAEIKFVSSSGVWQLTSNNRTGVYYNVITSQNVSDSVTTTSSSNVASSTAAKTAYDQATLGYGRANSAYAAANSAANTVRVTANSGSAQSAVSLNFINTPTTRVTVGAGTTGNANVSFTVIPTFTTEVNTTAGITSVGSIFTGTSIGNATLSSSSLTLQGNTANITNATVVLAASPNAAGLSYLELGGSTGGYIDFKAPNSDDYDHRIFSSTASGFTIYAGSTTAAANVLSIVSGNVNIDSGTFFVDYLANEVGIGTSNPTTKLDVVGSANVSGSLNVSVDIKSSGDIFGLDRVTIGSASRITGIAGITAVSGVTMASNSAVVGEMALAHYSTVIDDSSSIRFVKSSSTTIGAKSGIASGETLGQISFGGFGGAGTVARTAAVIRGTSDGSPTDSSMPGELIFSTTPSGTIIPVDRMVISNTGFVGIGTSNPTTKLDVVGSANVSGSLNVSGVAAFSSNVDIGGAASITYTGSEEALKITQKGTGNALLVEDQTSPDPTAFLISNTGLVVSGTTNPVFDYEAFGAGSTPRYQVHSSTNSLGDSAFGAIKWRQAGNAGAGGGLLLARSANNNVGVMTAVSDGLTLGILRWAGTDGTTFAESAAITTYVDGTVSTGSVPGKIQFQTTSPGGSGATTKMVIDSNGNLGIGTTNPKFALDVVGDANVTGNIAVTGSAIFTGTIVDRPVVSIAASASYAENAAGKTIVVNSASPVTLTFGAAAYSGFIVDIIRKGAGNVTIANTSTIAKLNVASVQPASNISSRYAAVRVTYTATNEFILTGSIQP